MNKFKGSELLLLLGDINTTSAQESPRAAIRCLDIEVDRLGEEVSRPIRPDPLFSSLKSVCDAGNIPAPTIRLERGRSDVLRVPATCFTFILPARRQPVCEP